jgi:hypothetical protein
LTDSYNLLSLAYINKKKNNIMRNKIQTIDTKGFAHHFILVAVVLVFAVSGVAYMVATKAATSSRMTDQQLAALNSWADVPTLEADPVSNDQVTAAGSKKIKIKNNGSGKLYIAIWCPHDNMRKHSKHTAIKKPGRSYTVRCGHVKRGDRAWVVWRGMKWPKARYCASWVHPPKSLNLPRSHFGQCGTPA